MMAREPREYLNPETLNAYFAALTPTIQPLSTDPDCWLRIDPSREVLELLTPESGESPDLVTYERLRVDLDDMEGRPCFRLEVDTTAGRYEAYSLLATIVDAMCSGQTFAVATQASVQSFKDLFSKRRGLTPQREQGLIGELLVLQHLVEEVGPKESVAAWLGPQAEEHDFVLADFDAEIKTTTSEKRAHVINSATQLLASPGRPLWLISIQLTRAGAAMASVSLSGLVGELRQRLDADRDRFIAYLGSVGWRDQDEELYRMPYMLRSLPAGYLVDDEFPAITRPRIDAVVPQPELVGGLSYRVDVSSLGVGTPPPPLEDFVGNRGI